jgi:hypothetical protein
MALPSMARLASLLVPAALGGVLLAAPAAPAAAAQPASAGPALRIVPLGAYKLGTRRIALHHQRIRFRGLVRPFVPGQVVSVRVLVGGRRYVHVRRTVRPRGSGGDFVVALKARRLGRMRAVAAAGGVTARSRPVDVIRRSAAYGQRGLHVRFLQRRLRELRYLVGRSGRLVSLTGFEHRVLQPGGRARLDELETLSQAGGPC